MDRERKQALSKWSLATRLLAERRAILQRLAALNHHSPGRDPGLLGGDNTPTSEVMEAAQETLATEIEFASREVLVARLKALARAEEKIRQGTYGRCDVCGQPIPPARLRAMPEAVRCVPCTAQREQRLSSSHRAA
jgi:RNA polymerase-binding transcription factor DksA